MEVLDHREKEFPKDLEGRLNAVLNVVNTEFKTLTLLHLDDYPASCSEIKSRIRENVGVQIYLPHESSFGKYCNQSLFPIGTVAEEDIVYEDKRIITSYKLTEAGKKYGRPIAAFTLDYGFKNDLSMLSILGVTHSNREKRSPSSRIKILEKLREGDLRVTDLMMALNLEDSTISLALNTFNKIGFVNFDSFGETFGKGRFKYIWIEDKDYNKLVPLYRYSKLTYKIAEKLKELGKSDCHELSISLGNIHINMISSILSHLEKHGFTRREDIRWKAGKVLSKIALLDKGKKFLDNYIYLIKDVLNDGIRLKEMNSLHEKLVLDVDRLRKYSIKAVNNYKRISPHVNQKPVEETQEKIIKYLKINPGKRACEIKKDISLKNLHSYLTPLFNLGKVTKTRDGKVVRYYVNE
ncbi:ArsR family transcriptional regulator [Candidatus Woesearchaeota archaeon]|nr:ArsR family transcriptional regulator [Candidatus Woesearchaeota archaeon]